MTAQCGNRVRSVWDSGLYGICVCPLHLEAWPPEEGVGRRGQRAQRTSKRLREGDGSYVCCAKLLQLCQTLHDPMDCSPRGSSVHGILQARILEWVAISSPPGDPPNPGIEPSSLTSPELAGRFFITSATWKESWEL